MHLTLQLDEPWATRLQTQATKQQVSVTEFIYQFLDKHWSGVTESDAVNDGTEQIVSQYTDDPFAPVVMQDGEIWTDDDLDEWHNDDWIEKELANPTQHPHIRSDDAYWEKIYAEMRAIDPEHEAEMDRKYGTGLEALYKTAGMIDTGLPAEEIRYLIESPELSQENIWLTLQKEA
ncbi:MAG: hypothetical protein AAF639_42600 [Chloroflexota bacterium]